MLKSKYYKKNGSRMSKLDPITFYPSQKHLKIFEFSFPIIFKYFYHPYLRPVTFCNLYRCETNCVALSNHIINFLMIHYLTVCMILFIWSMEFQMLLIYGETLFPSPLRYSSLSSFEFKINHKYKFETHNK